MWISTCSVGVGVAMTSLPRWCATICGSWGPPPARFRPADDRRGRTPSPMRQHLQRRSIDEARRNVCGSSTTTAEPHSDPDGSSTGSRHARGMDRRVITLVRHAAEKA